MSLLGMRGGHVALASAVWDCGIVECGAIPTPVPREIEALLDQLVATCTPVLRRTAGLESPLCRTGSHILPSLGIKSKSLSHTRTLQVSGRIALELWCSSQR